MIRHIVLFSAKDPADAAVIKAALERMAPVSGATTFEVAFNAKRDALSTEIDVVLYSEFETWTDLETYQSHPLYRETTDVVRPLRDQRIVVDYEGNSL